MSIYHQDNIKLQEAMTMGLTQFVQLWHISGLHVEYEDIPRDANVLKTAVIKSPTGHILLVIGWTSEEKPGAHVSDVAEVSNWEELRERFPHLFELEGSLDAFP